MENRFNTGLMLCLEKVRPVKTRDGSPLFDVRWYKTRTPDMGKHSFPLIFGLVGGMGGAPAFVQKTSRFYPSKAILEGFFK